MGNQGVIVHHDPHQIWSEPKQAEMLGRHYAKTIGVDFVAAAVKLECYAKAHARRNYHGKPGGPLDCGD